MPVRALIAIGAIAAWSLWLYSAGYSAGKAGMVEALRKEQSAVLRAAEAASRKEAERLAAEQERDALAQALEDQAYAEPVTGTCLPVSRVLRLNQR